MSERRTPLRLICECLGVSEEAVTAAIQERGLSEVKQVTACTGAGGGCTVCHPAIRACLAREEQARLARRSPLPAAATSSRTPPASRPDNSASQRP